MTNRQAGITLMELMVVIAIIAILSGIAIPNAINWRNNAQVNSAARGLYSDLQSARTLAIKENRDCTVTFNNSGRGSYTVSMENKADKTINFSKYGAVALNSANFNNSNEITFRSNGFAYDANGNLTGGSVELHGAINIEIVLTPLGNVRIM